MLSRRQLGLALLMVFGTSCRAADPAQIVVIVRSDMVVPDELDEVRVELFDASSATPIEAQAFALGDGAGRHRLPASFGIAPRNGDIDRPVHARIAALVAGAERFDTQFTTRFVSGVVLRLEVFLARRCVAEAPTCPPGQTCGRDGCAPIAIDPGTLPRYVPGDEAEDAGFDRDAGMDASVDAAARDAAIPDAGTSTYVVPVAARTCSAPADCGPGFDCRDDFGSVLHCRGECNANVECAGMGVGSLCDAGGYCSQPCDPFTSEGCPAGSVCGVAVTSNPPLYDEPVHVTVCRAENPAGTDGALCDDTDLGGHADCAAGHLCVSGTCRELCRVTPDSCAVHRCVSFTASVDYVHDLVIAGGGPTGYCEP